jgi:hypothetical protein
VDDVTWRAHQKLWTQAKWNCGDTLCFARIRVPHGDSFVEGDFTNTPIVYLGKDKHGMLVEFAAAWTRRETLVPVLVPR